MIHILNFVLICCLFLSAESLTGQISPPSNLSLMWDRNFDFTLSWAPPQHPMNNCEYEVSVRNKDVKSQVWNIVSEPYWKSSTVLEDGFLELSVQTICGDRESDVVLFTMSDPELVNNFSCSIISLKSTRCSWLKAANIADLRFFYRLYDNNNTFTRPLQECPSYRDSGGIKTGCDLQANVTQHMFIYINGTFDSKPVRNIFERDLWKYVKPPPLDWNVTETKNEFIINWIPPEVKLKWKYLLKYTECKTEKEINIEVTTHKLPKVSHCQYWISIKAENEGSGTPWTKEKYFAADTDHNTMVYAAVFIPLVFAGLAIFAFVCCRKNKENIFPKIPEPRNLLSDIYNNNNCKVPVQNLYIPEEEEDTCKITLVTDPPTDKL